MEYHDLLDPGTREIVRVQVVEFLTPRSYGQVHGHTRETGFELNRLP
jgi:hypothetical protein